MRGGSLGGGMISTEGRNSRLKNMMTTPIMRNGKEAKNTTIPKIMVNANTASSMRTTTTNKIYLNMDAGRTTPYKMIMEMNKKSLSSLLCLGSFLSRLLSRLFGGFLGGFLLGTTARHLRSCDVAVLVDKVQPAFFSFDASLGQDLLFFIALHPFASHLDSCRIAVSVYKV